MTTQEIAGTRERDRLRSMIDGIKIGDLMNKNYPFVSPEEQLSDVLKKMGQMDLHEIPVSADGKHLMGVISYGTLLKRRNLSTSTKAGSISIMPQEVTPEMAVSEVAEIFLRTGYRQVPVVKGQIIQGLLSRSDLIKIAQNIKELKGITVQEIMTTPVQTVHAEDPVETALMSMKNLTIRTLPVVDTQGRLSGIVGIKEVANYNWRDKHRETVGEIAGNSSPVDLKVSSIALDGVFTIEPQADLGKAVSVMLDRKISSLPVVDNGSLVGIVTKYDIIELLASFKQRDMVYTQITGLEQDDRFALDQMDKQIATSLQKISKISRPMLFSMHVTKYNAQGNTYKYSLNGRLITDHKVWVANAVDWDLIKATDSLMDHFERRIIERKEESLDHRRRSREIRHL